MNWTTFDGREVSLQQVPHSHLSNIIWFRKIFGWGVNQEAVDEIYRRFEGKILPYSPHPSFKAEWRALEQKGMITTTTYGLKIIAFEGQVIGYVWDEFKNATSILKIEPRKLVGFTRLDKVKKGDKIIFMNDKSFSMEVADWHRSLVLREEYTVNGIEFTRTGDTVVRLEGLNYLHRLQRFARWIKPEGPRVIGRISLDDLSKLRMIPPQFKRFSDMTFEEMGHIIEKEIQYMNGYDPHDPW